jgi:hypothetical protein
MKFVRVSEEFKLSEYEFIIGVNYCENCVISCRGNWISFELAGSSTSS